MTFDEITRRGPARATVPRHSSRARNNGYLACASRPKTLEILPTLIRPPPPRQVFPQMKSRRLDIVWKREAILAMQESGDKITVKEFYAYLLRKWPILEHGKKSFVWKARVALQRSGLRICPKCGKKFVTPKYKKGTKVSPVIFCDVDGTHLPSTWYLRPEYITKKQEETIDAYVPA